MEIPRDRSRYGVSTGSPESPETISMSISPLILTRRSTGQPGRMLFRRERPGFPATILVILLRRANLIISSAMLRPVRVAVSAPNCSASRRLSMAWLRSASGSSKARGASTYTANSLARSPSAFLAAYLITPAEDGPGLTQTKILSTFTFKSDIVYLQYPEANRY